MKWRHFHVLTKISSCYKTKGERLISVENGRTSCRSINDSRISFSCFMANWEVFGWHLLPKHVTDIEKRTIVVDGFYQRELCHVIRLTYFSMRKKKALSRFLPFKCCFTYIIDFCKTIYHFSPKKYIDQSNVHYLANRYRNMLKRLQTKRL